MLKAVDITDIASKTGDSGDTISIKVSKNFRAASLRLKLMKKHL